MTDDEPRTPVDVVRTKCPMCGALAFDGIVHHTVDGAVMASLEMQKEAQTPDRGNTSAPVRGTDDPGGRGPACIEVAV